MSDYNLSLTLQLSRHREMAEGFRRIAEEMKSAGKAAEEFEQKSSGVRGSSRGGYGRGPYQRLENVRKDIDRFIREGGSDAERNDLSYRYNNARRQVSRLENPPGFREKITDAIMSSRFGLGNMNPLVGRTLSAVKSIPGVGGLAGGAAGGIVLAAYKATEALYKLADRSAQLTRQFTDLQAQSGGTPYGTSLLQSLGISGDASRSLLDRITSDPVSMGVASRYGVNAVGGPYGTMDSAGATLKIVEGLRHQSEEQQRRDMRILGLEGFAGLMKISDNTFSLLKRDAALRSRIMDPRQQARSAEFGVAQDRLGESAKNVLTTLGSPAMQSFTNLMNTAADGLNYFADALNDNRTLLDGFWFTVKGLGFRIPDMIQEFLGGTDSGDSGNPDQKENTEALNRLTKTFQNSEMAKRAYPQAVQGQNLHRALAMGALPQGTI